MYQFYNPSPVGARVGDCAIRAVSKALNTDWNTAYSSLCAEGYKMGDLPNSNAVINSLLMSKGFERGVVPNTCPNCYTVGQFADDNPQGVYVLGTGNHVVCVDHGVVFDSWDSSLEIPIYFWKKKEGN
jgi:hypothetical protein